MTTDEGTNSETEGTEKPEETPGDKPETGTKPNDVAAMEAALKKANREAESARRKLKEIEDAGKSETDKLREEAASAKKEAADAKKDLLRLRVGSKKNLPPSVAARLQGETEEEMEADADALLAELKPNTPSGDADQGKRGETPDPSKDMNALLRKAAIGS